MNRLLYILMLFSASFCWAQSDSPYSGKFVTFKYFSGPIILNDSCMQKLSWTYGFTNEYVSDTIVSQKQIDQWNILNAKSEKIMTKRHGKDWRLQYNDALKKCRGIKDLPVILR